MATTARPTTLSASTLINEPVRNLQGEKIGKIEDYMIDLDRGCIDYAVLSFGGFLGVGEKLFAIPWHSMRLDTENHEWLLDASEESLKEAPGFDKENWPDFTSSQYRESLAGFWAVNAAGERTMTHSAGGHRETPVERDYREPGAIK